MSDLDLPLLPGADQIRRRKFATVRRGFDPDQVQDFLNQVATQVETLEGDLREARSQPPSVAEAPAAPAPVIAAPAAAASTEEAYAQLSQRFATVLRSADEESTKLVADATAEAKKILDEAQAEADKIRLDAQSSAEEARTKSAAELERARVEADRVLGGLDQRREALLAQMHEMQSRLLAVAGDLDVTELEPAAPGATSAAPTPPAAGPPAAGPPTTTGPPATGQPAAAKPMPPNRDAAPPPAAPPPPQQQPSGAPAPIGTQTPGGDTDEDAVDPRYEDLWASAETKSVEIPDLSSLDIDFDEEE